MFKPDEQAVVVSSGKHVTVKAVLRKPIKDVMRPIETTDGIYDESELLPAHPTVLATAQATPPKSIWDDVKAEAAKGPTLDYALRNALTDALRSGSFDVDVRGHWKNGSGVYDINDFRKRILELVYPFGRDLVEDDLRALQEAIRDGNTLDRWVAIGRCSATATDGCSYCNARHFYLETNGKTVRFMGEECPLPNGFTPNEWELNVPSGKIVVANDLRKWFPLPKGDDDIESVNGVRGQRQTSQAYASVGMCHGFVGNTCPDVLKLGDGQFKISNPPAEEKWDGENWVVIDPPPKVDGKSVVTICTDLWWYSLCDYDEFKRRSKKFGGSVAAARGKCISVKPGVYRFLHNDDVADSDGETVYATFEWVRDPDPVTDFLAMWESVDVNPLAYVQAKVKAWPTLYGACVDHNRETALSWSEMTEEQKLSSWRRVADHVFCTIGGGVEWHEKGFPLCAVDPTVPDIEPPSFRSQNHWYPFSRPYGGLFEPKKLSPSFAKLAFRILESVISFGIDVRDGEHSRDVKNTRGRMALAVDRYRELAKKYPKQADPDYVWWLRQKLRAETWVERFDLGPTFTEKHRKHVESQRWVPEDAYAVEFDARKLESGHFAWATGGWAHKKDANRYAIEEWSGDCSWICHAKNTAIPLYSVARVVRVGEVSHMGATLVELAFDYGTQWMQTSTKRKALNEKAEKDGIRILTREEYEALLPTAKEFFEGAYA